VCRVTQDTRDAAPAGLPAPVFDAVVAAMPSSSPPGSDREHGVAEYWLADPCLGEVTVEHFATRQVRCFEPGSVVRSLVLPRLRLPVARIFDAGPCC